MVHVWIAPVVLIGVLCEEQRPSHTGIEAENVTKDPDWVF